jgi:1-deoxy-D-xylulose-5-phosphate reductoisomerase
MDQQRNGSKPRAAVSELRAEARSARSTPGAPRRVVILGATGSVGGSALAVAERFPDRIQVVGLAAHRQADQLRAQAARFGVRALALADETAAAAAGLPGGDAAVAELAALPEADVILNAIVGAAGLRASLAAIAARKTLALANKESLVVAGELLVGAASRYGAEILPIDSEHNAALQCLQHARADEVDRLILTASGGPFRSKSAAELRNVELAEVLNHPTWSMGPRITVDSATLLNKGFEVIEARWLFGLPLERIEVLVHPQSIVHAMVHLRDGSLLAMMSSPDMRIPIQYALSYPERWPADWKPLDLGRLGRLEFEPPDLERFPCLALGMEAARRGGTVPAVLNAADETLVAALLAGRIHFSDLPSLLRDVVEAHDPMPATDVETILAADAWARAQVESTLAGAPRARPALTHGARG